MTFIEKVKESVELTTGCRFYYHAAGELNEVLAGVDIGEDPIAFAYLLKGGEVAVGKNCREGVNLAVFFCKKTEFDFNSYENEQLIDYCKQLAFGWVSWFSKSNTLEIVGNVTTERVYDTTTDILTGIAVNITLRELVGYGMCDIRKPVLVIEKNGVYTIGAYDVKVDVHLKIVDLLATYNGTYLPSEYGADAFSKVDVDLDVTSQCGFAEFGKVIYTNNIFKRIKKLNASCFDTSNVKDMKQMFYECSSLTTLDVSGWNTSNVGNMSYMFYYCSSLTTLDVSGWDTSNVGNMDGMFRYCSSLTTLDVSGWNTSNVTTMSQMFDNCSSLTTLDVSGWNTSNVGKMSYMFRGCHLLISIIGEHTLEDVENGLTTFFGLRISISISANHLRFSSMLSMLNGFADMTGNTAPTVTFNTTAWDNMRNDDDTIPNADTIAERQARLSAIAAQKNWNIAH